MLSQGSIIAQTSLLHPPVINPKMPRLPWSQRWLEICSWILTMKRSTTLSLTMKMTIQKLKVLLLKVG
ncbi:hypothetical protein EB796_005130 [Bugula neritina]|uniref:Uncharacterized protein n=1 Tax=Bugula neritina TaxID=10212 RepID=A0A7J7KEE0_BUGNE|nr:hypothetical protein EB796_005130 [Bugula neritina]